MKVHLCFIPIVLALITINPGAAFAQYLPANNVPAKQSSTAPQKIADWFSQYDGVRRGAQMSPSDRSRADAMMSKGLSMIMPGEEKGATQAFLRKLIQKNSTAAEALKQLPLYPETEQLHRGYYQYFTQAAKLFQDYITIQNNLFAVDAQGKGIAGGLLLRKQNLEVLDQNNKALDAQLRQQFHIAAYRFQ